MEKKKKKQYKKKLHTEKKTGILEKNKAGFGFVRQEEDGDIFIAKSNMGDAMHGDLVEVDLLPEYLWRRKSREGLIDKVLERAHTEVVGTFQKNKRFGFVVPDDARNNDDIFVKKADFRSAQNGDKVVVKITKYPERMSAQKARLPKSFLETGKPAVRLRR